MQSQFSTFYEIVSAPKFFFAYLFDYVALLLLLLFLLLFFRLARNKKSFYLNKFLGEDMRGISI